VLPRVIVQVPNVEKFMEQYQMECSLAKIRLHVGLPSTKVHGVGTR
jgi:VPS28 protein